eukprot:Skav228872  [mRNA]  locus=scaffold816:387783:402586:+ [translate_table: standard]
MPSPTSRDMLNLRRGRFRKIFLAANSNAPGPPADLRYVKKSKLNNPRHAELHGDIVDFLHRIYTSIAETLPDVRDETLNDVEFDEKGNILELSTDPYLEAAKTPNLKPRKKHRSITVRDTDLEVRYLPPGNMKEYWMQYQSQSSLTTPASFPAFWRVSALAPALLQERKATCGDVDVREVYFAQVAGGARSERPASQCDAVLGAIPWNCWGKASNAFLIGVALLEQWYILCLLDFTILPNSAKQVSSAVNVMTTILGMGCGNIAHVQLPVFQKQAKQATIVAHRKNVEEMILKAGLSLEHQIVLLFDKSNCMASDARSVHQYCVAAYHKQFVPTFDKSEALQQGRIEALPLLPVSEFYGYDETAKPGPGILQSYMKGMDVKDTDRHTEFARAAADMNLNGCPSPVYYCGIVAADRFTEIQTAVQSQCYEKWDASPDAPSPSRPVEAAQPREISLDILAFNSGLDKPVWPQTLDQKFLDGPEKVALKELKDAFEAEFGRAMPEQPRAPTTTRVSGSCDFAFDGKMPLDVDRIIDPAFVPADQMSADRPDAGSITGAAGDRSLRWEKTFDPVARGAEMMSVLKDKAIKDKSRRPGNGGADSDGEKSKNDDPPDPTGHEVPAGAGDEAEQAELVGGDEDGEEEPAAEDACLEDPPDTVVPTQTKERGQNVD